ncbi:MAG: phosphotransferase, partial [Acidimicrobiia bacterium]|nr:phosphotransferase [Acidimicrobiia bacterium]
GSLHVRVGAPGATDDVHELFWPSEPAPIDLGALAPAGDERRRAAWRRRGRDGRATARVLQDLPSSGRSSPSSAWTGVHRVGADPFHPTPAPDPVVNRPSSPPPSPRIGLAAGVPPFAPDPAVPARDRLLDAGFMAAHLARTAGARGPLDLGGCRIRRAKYRIGESLRVVHEFDLDGTRYIVAARTFPADRIEAAAAKGLRRARPVAGGALRSVWADPELGAVFWTFPNDRRLDNLRELFAPPPTISAGIGRPARFELVEYAPEGSATARVSDNAGTVRAYLKAYHGRDVAALASRYDAVASQLVEAGAPLRTPRALAWDPTRALLALEPLPGVPWSQLGPARLPDAFGRLGAACAAMHDLSPERLASAAAWSRPAPALGLFGRLAVPRVLNSARLVGRARPDVEALCAELATGLAAGPPRALAPDVVLHGDLHPGNVLVDGDRLNLIDLDQSGIGPAAMDLASLLARLRFESLVGARDTADARQLRQAFLAGYGERRRLPATGELAWYEAAALVAERAMRAVNRVHPLGLIHLQPTLEEARRILEESSR